MNELYQPPWELTGEGTIILYRQLPHPIIESISTIPSELRKGYCGGPACLMLVDYHTSPVGPYGELLLIPGKFRAVDWRHKKRKLFTISSIFVSSSLSVIYGRANWAIPKELADFSISQTSDKGRQIVISQQHKEIASCVVHPHGFSFPVTTKLLPFPLIQYDEHYKKYTSFLGKGKGKLCTISELSINGSLFPDISSIRPLGAIHISPFTITFPRSIEVPL